MDSPDRNLTMTAADTQGSPFFNYLCSLSPIKPVKSVHVVQTFSELSFPPPPAVFVSPRIDTQKDSSFLRRSNTKGRAELLRATAESVQGKLLVDKGKGFMVPLSEIEDRISSLNQLVDRGHTVQNINSTKGARNEQCVLASPCSSPSKLGSKYVEQYLADPFEEELFPVGSSQKYPKATTLELVQFPSYMDVDVPQDLEEQKQNIEKHLGTPSLAAKKVKEESEMRTGRAVFRQGTAKTMAPKKLGFAASISKDKSNDVHDSSNERTLLNGHLNSQQEFSYDARSLEPGHATTDFSFLLSEGGEKVSIHGCLENWQSSSASAVLHSPPKHASGYLATMTEIVNEDVRGMQNDAVFSQMGSLEADKSEFALDFNDEADLETEMGSEQQVVTAHRVLAPSYRGGRRRCLDFEVSEAQAKNLNGLPSFKTLELGSNIMIQDSCFSSDTSIVPSVLTDRAAATSDTINSESQQGLDSIIHASLRVDLGARSKALPPHSSMLRLARCSSQKSTDYHSDKSDSQLVCITRNSGTSPISVGMPSGIGLHLNSLAGSMTLAQSMRENNNGNNLLASSKSPTPSLKEGPSENHGNCTLAVSSGGNLQVGSTASFGPGLVVSVVEKTRMDQHEVQSAGSAQVGVTKSTTCFRSVTLGIKQLEKNSPFGAMENFSPLGRKRVLLQEFPGHTELDVPEESNQSPRSPKKKRKSAPAGEKLGENCKRCNCKKSKCLKLYCECFAAGVYCVDSCACRDCFNKPEYEETVLGTRQQIESRNPLAFAPKIIRAADSSPTNGEECGDTPASARHKRGCNCKKSHCLKKYCECYQAGVGCSEGCRCEGCKNVYGRKEGSGDFEDKESQFELINKEIVEDHPDALELSNAFAGLNHQGNQDLSPITPAFQHPGQVKTTSKLRTTSGKRRFLTEELHSPMFSQSAVKPSKSPSRLLRSSRGAQNPTVADSEEINFANNADSPISTPKDARIEQVSPRWEGLVDICTLTPLPQAPLRPTPASASIFDRADSSPSFNRQSNELTSSCNGSIRAGLTFMGGSSSPAPQQVAPSSPACTFSSDHFQTPLNAQTTTVTPILSSPLCASGSKSGFMADSNIYSHRFVASVEDDDTPDFLKDPDTACSPLRILKTGSPKQKRVSPPHHKSVRDTEGRGMTSPGLRSGRKFILQAIPSFPPTPSFSSVREQISSSKNQD